MSHYSKHNFKPKKITIRVLHSSFDFYLKQIDHKENFDHFETNSDSLIEKKTK